MRKRERSVDVVDVVDVDVVDVVDVNCSSLWTKQNSTFGAYVGTYVRTDGLVFLTWAHFPQGCCFNLMGIIFRARLLIFIG